MTLRKAVVGKRVDLLVDPSGRFRVDPVPGHACHQLFGYLRHAFVRALVSHGAAQLVGLPRREPRSGDGHLHALLLKERHAERATQHRLEGGMRVGDRLEAGPAVEEGMHHVTLDRSRTNECHLDDEIVECARLHSRQRVHLGPALDLEQADGVRTAEVVVHRLVIHRYRAEIESRRPGCG